MTSHMDRRSALLAALSTAVASIAAKAQAQTPAGEPAKPLPPRPPISAYAASPLVDEIALSPDGTRVCAVTQIGDEKLLSHFKLGEPSKFVRLGKIKVRGLFWADNKNIILVSSQTAALEGFVGKKHEFRLAQCINLDTAKTYTLFEGERGFYAVVMGNLGRIKIGEKYYVTASNFNFGTGLLSLYKFDAENQRSHQIASASQDAEDFVVAADGYVLGYNEFNEKTKVWELFMNSVPRSGGDSARFKSVYRFKDPDYIPELIGLGASGDTLILYIDDDNGGDYYEIGLEGKLSEPIDKNPVKYGRAALFHPVTRNFVGFSRHNDWFTYEYTDPLLKKMADAIPQVLEDGYRFSIVDQAEDPRKIIIYAERHDDSGTYFHIDFSTGAVQQLAVNYPAIGSEWITQKTPIDYKAADGLSIHAYLTLPPHKAARNLPLVVLPHGGPEARDYIDYDWQAQALASLGYCVLQPNFRGSAGYGKDFTDAGHGEFGRKMQTDLSDGVRHLMAQGLIDPKRVAIVGASYGGYAALAGATLDTGVYNCAISIAGVSDPKTMIEFEISNSTTRKSTSVLYWKAFMGDPQTYDDISPARQAAKAYCPILLIHGTDDTVVPISQSQRMEKALKAANKPVEFITYKGQDHWETIESARIEMMTRVVDFLGKHNPA